MLFLIVSIEANVLVKFIVLVFPCIVAWTICSDIFRIFASFTFDLLVGT